MWDQIWNETETDRWDTVPEWDLPEEEEDDSEETEEVSLEEWLETAEA